MYVDEFNKVIEHNGHYIYESVKRKNRIFTDY